MAVMPGLPLSPWTDPRLLVLNILLVIEAVWVLLGPKGTMRVESRRAVTGRIILLHVKTPGNAASPLVSAVVGTAESFTAGLLCAALSKRYLLRASSL